MMSWLAQAGVLLLLFGGLCAEGDLPADADNDVPLVLRLRPENNKPPEFSRAQTIPLFPEIPQSDTKPADTPPRAERLQPQSRYNLIRFVSGEFARAVKPLPIVKRGFHYPAGKPLDEQVLRQAVTSNGSAASPGDTVQITGLEFRAKEIVVQINGGSKKKTPWRERVQVSVGGMPTSRTTVEGGPQGYQRVGATLILDYGRPLPDLTPEELKQHLGVFLDFSKQRSATVHWVETLPPEFQEAIKDRRAMVGMDREMVIAALGKPQRKVREKDLDGLETEDWIYGHPPSKTVFVKFAGDKVIGVKQFPN